MQFLTAIVLPFKNVQNLRSHIYTVRNFDFFLSRKFNRQQWDLVMSSQLWWWWWKSGIFLSKKEEKQANGRVADPDVVDQDPDQNTTLKKKTGTGSDPSIKPDPTIEKHLGSWSYLIKLTLKIKF